MNLAGALVRLGSLVVSLFGLVAFGTLLSALVFGIEGVPAVGAFAVLGLLAVSVVAAVAWGRWTARAPRETPYW